MARNRSAAPAAAGGAAASRDGRAEGPGLPEIARLILGYRSAKILFAACSLGLFEFLRGGPLPAEAVARGLKLDRRACGVLLDALVGLGFLEKSPQGYRNSASAGRHLLEDSPERLLHNLRTQDLLWQAWSDLGRVLACGTPRSDLLKRLRDRRFTRDYLLGMLEISRRPAAEVAARLARPGLRRMLDVGAGPGAYSLALLESCPGLEAVLLDLPGTLRVTRGLVAGQPAGRRASLRAGDYHRADFGRDAFDLVLLSHVTHDEGEEGNRALLRKAAGALRRGGMLAVHDFALDPGRTSPLFGALFSVHMLVYTRQGRTYAAAEYEGWLREAGLTGIRRHAICAGAPNATCLITGEKP